MLVPRAAVGAADAPDAGADPFGPMVVPRAPDAPRPETAGSETPAFSGLLMERATGIEPATPSLGSSCSAS